MRHSLLSVQQQGAAELLVHSFESGIYLVEANVNKDLGYVTDAQGHNLCFRSISEVKHSFAGVHAPLWLIHESAYDEMCGAFAQHSVPMRVLLERRG